MAQADEGAPAASQADEGTPIVAPQAANQETPAPQDADSPAAAPTGDWGEEDWGGEGGDWKEGAGAGDWTEGAGDWDRMASGRYSTMAVDGDWLCGPDKHVIFLQYGHWNSGV